MDHPLPASTATAEWSSPGICPRTSIVMATRNKAEMLRRTLKSIVLQTVPFNYEIIVVDDGSTDDTAKAVAEHGEMLIRYGWKIRYFKLENSQYRNPSTARNVGYRAARGSVVIAQSDEVIHETPDAIVKLTEGLREGGNEFLIATVWDYDYERARRGIQYTGDENKRPFFFLGSLWRRDLYAVGGCSEDFVAPAFDDDWFALNLINGRGLTPRYMPDVIGHHQAHSRPRNLTYLCRPSQRLYGEKVAAANRGDIPWCAVGGPWKWVEDV